MKYAALLITFFIAAFPFGAFAMEGTLKCEVKDQQILVIKDGVSERYTSHKDDVKVGDSFLLKYGFSESNVFYLKRSQKDNVNPFSVFYVNLEFDTQKAVVVDNNSKFKHLLEDDGFLSTQLTISADEFEIGYVFGEGGFQFNRYYKSDWMGIYTYINSFVATTYTLNCRHTAESVWSEVFLKLKRTLNI